MPPSHPELHSLCLNGNLEELRTFLETTIYSLPQEERTSLCIHTGRPCHDVPCKCKVTNLAETAAKANQTDIFAYLWDSILGPRGCSISWASLKAAAHLGSISLGQIFQARDSECFNITRPSSPHGSRGGGSQLTVAMHHDNMDYIDFTLAHGADINNGFPNHSPIRAAVLSAIEDGEHHMSDLFTLSLIEQISDKSLDRVRFLVERGAYVRGSGALRAAAGEGRSNVVLYLIDNGSDVDDLGIELDEIYQNRTSSSLIAAAEAGHAGIIQILLENRADPGYIDRFGMSALAAAQKFDRARVVEVIREWQASH